MNKHLFILSHEVIQAMTDEEVAATVKGLKTLDLYHLPYPKVSLRIPNKYAVVDGPEAVENWSHLGGLIFNKTDGKWHLNYEDWWYIEFTDLNLLGKPMQCHLVCDGPPRYEKWNLDDRDLRYNYESCIDLLVTLLATRNALKTTSRDKLAALGIGCRQRADRAPRFEYTTTITVPEAPDEDDHTVRPGAPKAPHLRRGHIRHQHYGPGMSYRKMVWIAPTFVNADADFVSKRAAYNLGGHR
jgi:hypothetical protein